MRTLGLRFDSIHPESPCLLGPLTEPEESLEERSELLDYVLLLLAVTALNGEPRNRW